MKRVTTSIIVAALLVCTAAATASAKVKSRTVTVGLDFTIAGKTVKAGTYRFGYDDEKNELTVTDKKTNEVVVRAGASLERSKKGALPFLLLEGDSAPLSFAGLSFDGRQLIKTSAAAAQGQ